MESLGRQWIMGPTSSVQVTTEVVRLLGMEPCGLRQEQSAEAEVLCTPTMDLTGHVWMRRHLSLTTEAQVWPGTGECG